METDIEKKVSFIQYALPQLKDGLYNIKVEQSVSSNSNKLPEKNYINEKKFAVNGKRFSIDPASIVSVFPPEFSLGEFSYVLPHVILQRRTMPWERSVDGTTKNSTTNANPWLGLIVLNEDDVAPKAVEKTLLDLLPITQKNAFNQNGLLPNDIYYPEFPIESGKTWRRLDPGENWTDQCMVLDLTKELFNSIAPTLADLGWLAHVREVKIENKSETYIKAVRAQTDDLTPDVQLAEVIGNRFALAGQKCTVHLVCLEGFGGVLPKKDGSSNLPPDIKKVRLVSLKSWTYSAISQDYTFAGLLTNVNKFDGPEIVNTLQIQPKKTSAEPGNTALVNALKMGYAAFNHTTRLGDHTVSWYHGPLVPYPIKAKVPFPGNTSDQFTVYNPDSGMFDTSYSSAWQLGRLLGLQSNSFATTLYNWKRGLALDVIEQVEKEFLNMNKAGLSNLLKATLSSYVNEDLKSAAKLKNVGIAKSISSLKRVKNKESRLQALGSVMTNVKKLKAILLNQEEEVMIPATITNFISRLKLLYGLPFNYLVPDERMLPLESLRFFYVDNAWINALVEGALSIGSSTSGDQAMHQVVAPIVTNFSKSHAPKIRKQLFTKDDLLTTDVDPISSPSGFLLRSQVVSGWPGLEVYGYDAKGKELDILRYEQLSDGISICIFNGAVKKVILKEHSEALHFGVDVNIDDPIPSKFTKSFRYIVSDGIHQPGEEVAQEVIKSLEIIKYTRSTPSVLDIDLLATTMGNEVKNKIAYTGPFTSAEFALEMIEGVQEVIFEFGDSKLRKK